MLGSLCLHAAILALPLGGAIKERGLAISSAGSAIRAFLRPQAAPEPVRVPDLPEPVGEFRPPAAPEPEQRKEPAQPEQPVPSGASRESTSVVAIPATFFDPWQLTEPPRPLREPPLDLLHPVLARPGVAILVLYIDESGRVASVEIDSATLPPATAERAAAIFGGLPFSPGRIGATAVKSRVRITVGAEERKKDN